MTSSDPSKEHQLILRLPKDCADRVREALKTDALGERLQIEFHKDPLGTMRAGKVKFDEEILSAKLVDLPTITESYKTLDNKVVYKTGDIAQMMVCSHDPAPEEEEVDEKVNVAEMTAARKKELYKKFAWNHGITPPLKNVRKRRFRKIKTKKMIESPEVEKEVKRLLRADTFAVSVSFRVVNDEDKHNEDSQSVASDSMSYSNPGQLLQDEDSLLSNPPSSYQSDDKTELLRMLEEASCSSTSSDDSEDEEISVVEASPENEEVVDLRLAIQDLENQIEEQKLKIENTTMSLLRNRFETFLDELEKQRKTKLDELEQLLR